ncbi:MAG TPA: hypothetical protein ENK18_10920 [Deltaproteobacteria bacterium]|nr:hypothetical protein [Deltaproteobacteria bacterium]
MDTTRRQYIDRYSDDGVVRMPFLTSLLEQGVVLDDHQQCASWTFPSTNCTLSGTLLEEMEHVPRFGASGSPVPEGQRTISGLLRDQGFHTILVSSNGWLDPADGNAQGYTDFRFEGGAASVFDGGLSMLEDALAEQQPERWMMHLHFIEPHDAYNPPSRLMPELEELDPIDYDPGTQWGHDSIKADYPGLPTEEQELIKQHLQIRYTGELRWLDEQLEDGWRELEKRGLLDDTLVVFWTDHGEAFWERGRQAHAWFLGAEENDALLGFWHRDLQPRSWSGPTHSVDLMPTVLQALGITPPDDLAGEIIGLAPEDRIRFTAVDGFIGVYQAVTVEGWKLQIGWDGSVGLWDRNTDRMETRDLYVPGHPKFNELWPLLRERVLLMEPLVPEHQVEWGLLP